MKKGKIIKSQLDKNLTALNLDNKLVDVLLKFGISPNLLGYHYLKEGIKVLMNEPTYSSSITKKMYPIIANKFATTALRVERGIRHALDVSYNKGKISYLNEMVGFEVYADHYKPSNSEFVSLIADRLSLQYK